MRKIALALGLLAVSAAPQQAVPLERPPYVGYVFPAGGARGSTFEVRVGGENVYGATAAVASGKGVAVEVTDSKEPESLLAGLQQKKKKKANQTVIDEIVKLRVTVAADAEPGPREVCLVTPRGLSNKRVFQVDPFKEVRESEPNNTAAAAASLPELPVLINGQILPGDVDRFKFAARKGQQLVVETSARALIPYIADAVPGWFQAIVSLYDPQGKEVAVADDFPIRSSSMTCRQTASTGWPSGTRSTGGARTSCTGCGSARRPSSRASSLWGRRGARSRSR